MTSFTNLLCSSKKNTVSFCCQISCFCTLGAAVGLAIFGQKHKRCFLQALLIFKPFPVFPLQPTPPILAGTERQKHPIESEEKFNYLKEEEPPGDSSKFYLLSMRKLSFTVRWSSSRLYCVELQTNFLQNYRCLPSGVAFTFPYSQPEFKSLISCHRFVQSLRMCHLVTAFGFESLWV